MDRGQKMTDGSTKQGVRVHIRWLEEDLAHPIVRRHFREVLAIEQESFEHPWLEEDLVRYLRPANSVSIVAEHEDRVVGFMVYGLHQIRIDLLRFAVASDYRRRGVGTQMVAKLITRLSAQRRSRIVVDVEDTNLAAQLFFQDRGFRGVSVYRGYYAMVYRYRV